MLDLDAMQLVDETRTPPEINGKAHAWKAFFLRNGSALFQTALLLSGDAEMAEAALAGVIDDFDISKPPEKEDFAIWERAVVLRCITAAERASTTTRPFHYSMLQPGLWSVMEIDRYPRICFVLRLLLGYTAVSCAQLLGMEERTIQTFLRIAIMQLQHKAAQPM